MASLIKDIEGTAQASVIDKLQKNVNKNFEPKLTTICKVGGIYCHICEITFSHKKEFTDHYKIHREEEVIYTCVVCHKQIKAYARFRAHCYTVHVVGNKNRCHHCYKAFSNAAGLNNHIKAKHSQPQQCSVCLKKFNSKQEQQLHEIIHDNKDSPPYNCQICNLFLPTLDTCKIHAEAHTVLIYHCPICNENIDKQNATEHLKKHFDSNSFNEETTGVNIKDEGATEVNLKDKNATEMNIKGNNATEMNIRANDATEMNIKDKNGIEEDDSDNAETSVEHLGIACDYCTGVFRNKVEFDDHFSEEHEELVGGDLVYVCVVCNKKFDKYRGFASHAYNHAVKAKFSCNVCHKRFKRLSALATHTGVCAAGSQGGKPFACSECGHRYSLEGSLRKHLRAAHGIHRVRCPEDDCGETFATMKELVVHQYHHKSEQAWCRRCGMLFTSLAACEQHLEVHRQTLHSCPICSRDYPDRGPLMNHIMQHFESLILMCKICGKVFNQRRRFLYHMETHIDKQTHVCSYCSKGFRTQAQLRVHLNTHTGSKPYKCAVCHKAFGNYANLSKHKRRMHMKLNSVTSNHYPTSDPDSEIHSEDLCENEFITSDVIIKNNNLNTLIVDNKGGSNQQPYKCAVCHKAFDNYANLSKHKRRMHMKLNSVTPNRYSTSDPDSEIHSEDLGGDEFITSDAIIKNNNLNTLIVDNKGGSNQQPYKCAVCHKAFDNYANLSKHKRQMHMKLNSVTPNRYPTSDPDSEIHSEDLGEDEFITSDAIIKNNNLNTLIVDNKGGSNQQPYKCAVCHKAFDNYANLSKHKRLMHMKLNSVTPNRYPTSDTDSEIHSQDLGEDEFITSDAINKNNNLNTLIVESKGGSNQQPYKCAVCHKAFDNYANLSKHKRQMHMKLNSVTPNRYPTSDPDSEIHSEDLGEDEFITSDAIIKNNNLNTLIVDNKGGSNQQPYKCAVCHKTFDNYANLSKHKRLMHMKLKSVTPNRYPTSDSDSEIHSEDLGEDEFITSDSINKNNNLNTLIVDNKGGSNQQPYKCAVCHKAFDNYANLSKHKRRVHMKINTETFNHNPTSDADAENYSENLGEDEIIKSDAINKNNNLNTPRVDNKAGSNQQPYKCAVCHKTFGNNANLSKHKRRMHMKLYTETFNHNPTSDADAENYSENLGEDEIIKSDAINKNNNLNTPRVDYKAGSNQQPYKCAVCHKTFGNNANLSKHKRRMHMKLNTETFNHNPTSDADAENLGEDEIIKSDAINKNNNLNTPTIDNKAGSNQQPYKCAVCHKAFGNNANLSKHKRRMHMKLNTETVNHNPTSDADAEIHSENFGEDEIIKSDAINKNNNLNTPIVGNKAGSNQRKRPKKMVPENKIYKKRHSTFDVKNNLASINDDEALQSDAIDKYNNLNTPEIDEKLGESNGRQRQANIILTNKLHPTSDAKPENYSRNFEEDKFKTSHLKEPKMEKVVILDIQHVYYPMQNDMVKQDHIDMEPEPIDRIDLEKELQLIENISKSADNKDAVYGDVLSNSDTAFDYEGIEGFSTTGSSEQTNYPQEYGPEFAVQDCGILNLDDHILPHIDPLLTIKTVDYPTPNGFLPPNHEANSYQECQTPMWEPPIFKCPDYNYHGTSTYQEYQAPGWEPPVFTKVCPEYTYYADMADSNRASIMNSDIF